MNTGIVPRRVVVRWNKYWMVSTLEHCVNENLFRKWNKFIFNVKIILNYLVFENVSFKSWTQYGIHNVTWWPLVIFTLWKYNFWYFHSVKITACEGITFIQWINPVHHGWKCNKLYIYFFTLLHDYENKIHCHIAW